MYNSEYETIVAEMNDGEKHLLVKALDNPIKTIPSIRKKLIGLDLLVVYDSNSYTTTDLGYAVATYLQSFFTLQEESDPEVYAASGDRWRISFDITMPRPYGSFMAIEQFKDHVFLTESLESRAVSTAHSIVRSRYPTASRIRVSAREAYQLPNDSSLEFVSSNSSE